MSAIASDVRAVPAPLVIGVTGHRDLREEDVARLENKVQRSAERVEDTVFFYSHHFAFSAG